MIKRYSKRMQFIIRAPQSHTFFSARKWDRLLSGRARKWPTNQTLHTVYIENWNGLDAILTCYCYCWCWGFFFFIFWCKWNSVLIVRQSSSHFYSTKLQPAHAFVCLCEKSAHISTSIHLRHDINRLCTNMTSFLLLLLFVSLLLFEWIAVEILKRLWRKRGIFDIISYFDVISNHIFWMWLGILKKHGRMLRFRALFLECWFYRKGQEGK